MFKVTVRAVETMVGGGVTGMDAAAAWLADHMVIITGGATIDAPSRGFWKDANGVNVTEMGKNVWTLCQNEQQVAGVRELARDLRGMTAQDCVLFMVEEIRGEFV